MMHVLFTFLLVATTVQARSEFGLLRKSSYSRKGDHDDLLRRLVELEDSLQGETSISMSMSLSMSMSMEYSAPHTLTPSESPMTKHDLFPHPIGAPSTDSGITPPATPVPIQFYAITFSPAASPTMIPVYECSANGLVAVAVADHSNGGHSSNVTTTLDLKFTYEAEIGRDTMDDDLVNELELAFMESAIRAALDCNNDTTGFPQVTQYQHFNTSTALLGSCNATIANATCFRLETEIVVAIKKDIDPLVAANLAYGQIQRGMQNDLYLDEIATLKKLTFLTFDKDNEITLQPPATLDEVNTNTRGSKRSSRWVLGTCLGVLGGAILALMAVVTKKRLEHIGNSDTKESQDITDGESSAESSLDQGESGTRSPSVTCEDIDVA